MEAIEIGKGMSRGVFAIRGKGGYNVCFVKLKDGYQSGDRFNLAGVDKLIALLHFKDKESVDRLIGILNDVSKDMEAERSRLKVSRPKRRKKRL